MSDLAIVPPPASSTPALLTVERARDLLATCRATDEVRQLGDQANAMALYLRQSRAALEAQNDAAEIVIWARRRLGELTRDLPRASGAGRGKKAGGPGRTAALAELGLDPRDVARCEKLAATDEDTIVRHVRGVRLRAERLTTNGTIAAVSHGEAYDSDDWGTPPEWVELVRRVLGEIDLDPASSDRAQRTVRAKRYFTKADDGLKQPWKGRVFCNPPYSQPLCGLFIHRFVQEQWSKRLTKGIILLNASTDTSWFHALAARYQVCFTNRRIAFLLPDGTPSEGNRVGQIFVAANCGREFKELFEGAKVGTVLGR